MAKTSERFCITCDKVTTFVLKHNIGHSECRVCGSRFGFSPTNALIIHFQRKIKEIDNKNNGVYIKKLQDKIDNQRKIIVGLNEKVRIMKCEADKNGKER